MAFNQNLFNALHDICSFTALESDMDEIKRAVLKDQQEVLEEFWNDEEEDNFQPCEHCDLPDACSDMGCAVKCGIKQIKW